MAYDRVGVVPGSVGDVIIGRAPSPAPRQARMPMPRRRVDPDIVRTTTDFRPSPMPMRNRRGMP
jgi:hypothetical protein